MQKSLGPTSHPRQQKLPAGIHTNIFLHNKSSPYVKKLEVKKVIYQPVQLTRQEGYRSEEYAHLDARLDFAPYGNKIGSVNTQFKNILEAQRKQLQSSLHNSDSGRSLGGTQKVETFVDHSARQ